MTKKQHYMTRDERFQLEALHKAKVPISQIARQLGFSRQTIYNELRRGRYIHIETKRGYDEEIRYSADKAQQIHDYNQTAKGRPLKIGNDHAYADFLERKICMDRYSPAAALAAARREGYTTTICTATLYSYIDKEIFLHLTNKNLWVKSKKKKRKNRKVRRIVHPLLPSIINRPEHINQRQDLGHWEMDLVVGKANTKPALLTLTERVSRQELLFLLPDHKATTIQNVFNRLERELPDFKERFQSITTDNGPEFLHYENLCRSIYGGQRFQVYYCHSYAAWEKGSNENHNRMIRRFFPKGTDFRKVTEEEVTWVQDWMNNYPRKILGWYAPKDIA